VPSPGHLYEWEKLLSIRLEYRTSSAPPLSTHSAAFSDKITSKKYFTDTYRISALTHRSPEGASAGASSDRPGMVFRRHYRNNTSTFFDKRSQSSAPAISGGARPRHSRPRSPHGRDEGGKPHQEHRWRRKGSAYYSPTPRHGVMPTVCSVAWSRRGSSMASSTRGPPLCSFISRQAIRKQSSIMHIVSTIRLKPSQWIPAPQSPKSLDSSCLP
jgi:hypothetical protein